MNPLLTTFIGSLIMVGTIKAIRSIQNYIKSPPSPEEKKYRKDYVYGNKSNDLSQSTQDALIEYNPKQKVRSTLIGLIQDPDNFLKFLLDENVPLSAKADIGYIKFGKLEGFDLLCANYQYDENSDILELYNKNDILISKLRLGNKKIPDIIDRENINYFNQLILNLKTHEQEEYRKLELLRNNNTKELENVLKIDFSVRDEEQQNIVNKWLEETPKLIDEIIKKRID